MHVTPNYLLCTVVTNIKMVQRRNLIKLHLYSAMDFSSITVEPVYFVIVCQFLISKLNHLLQLVPT